MADPCAPLAAEPREPELDPDYRKQVDDRFDAVLAATRRRREPSVEIDKAKIVVFSDHHKGGRDKADDFQRCERAYCAALGYYLERGFKLFVLGDAEELWEEKPETVTRCYGDVLRLEAEFNSPERGGLVRFFGNHDEDWEDKGLVRRHLGPYFPGMREVREALLLPMTDGGDKAGQLSFCPWPPGNDRKR